MANLHQGAAAADFPEEWIPVEDPSFPIDVNIHIACEETEEVIKHLNQLIDQYRKYMRKLKDDRKEATGSTRLMDNNCYGTHVMNVNFNTTI